MTTVTRSRWTAALVALLLAGCTENERARSFGGSADVRLPPGQKLVTATWKENAALWLLTRPARPGEEPEVLTFQESSSYGLVEGTVRIHERAAKE